MRGTNAKRRQRLPKPMSRLRGAARAALAVLATSAALGASPVTTAWAASTAPKPIHLDGGATVDPVDDWGVDHSLGDGVLLIHNDPMGFFLVVVNQGTITNVKAALKRDAANLGTVRSLRTITSIKDRFTSFDRLGQAGFSLHAGTHGINTNFAEIVELLDSADGYRAFIAFMAFSAKGLQTLTPSVASMIGYIGDNSSS
jgi:hypothetical protein